MARSLLIGNGINRVTNQDASWENVLNALVPDRDLSGLALEHMKQKPFALVYEEILLTPKANGEYVGETAMKKRIAQRVGEMKFNDLEPVLNSVCEAYHDPQEHVCRARNRAERS